MSSGVSSTDLFYSHLKMQQDLGWIFRSGNAERREAMQRIVNRSDAKPERKGMPKYVVDLIEKSINSHRDAGAGGDDLSIWTTTHTECFFHV